MSSQTERPPPGSPAARSSLDAGSLSQSLEALCRAQLQSTSDPERKARLHRELGRLHELEHADLESAAAQYREALRCAPQDVLAIRGARRALSALARHAELPPLFEAERAVTADRTARARLMVEQARVLEGPLRQRDAAAKLYRDALELDPKNLQILDALERAYERDGAWEAVAWTYEARAAAVEDPTLKATWTARRAQLVETRLNDPIAALSLYEAAALADPVATDALSQVKRLGAAHGRWPAVISALRTELRLCSDPDARHGVWLAIARLEETRLSDPDAATETLTQALEARPGDPHLLTELARLHGALGRRDAQAQALARLVERTEDPARIVELCHRVGRLYEQEPRQVDVARGWYERALTTDPLHLAAGAALERILQEAGGWPRLLQIWSRRADATVDPGEEAALRHRMGHLLEARMQRAEEAAAQHARALGLDPDHHGAFEALARLHAQAGRWHELVELYERQVDRAAHDAQAILWLFRIGGILEDRLDHPDGALAAYERVLRREPTHLGALSAAARAARRAGRFDRLVEVLRAEAGLTSDTARSDALEHEAAALMAEQLSDPAGARRAVLEVLARSPEHRPSLETLAKLEADAGRWEALLEVYQRLLPLTPEPDRARRQHRMGEICAFQLGDHARAIGHFRAALAADDGYEPAREALIEALSRTGAHRALAEVLEQRLTRLTDPSRRAHAAVELGALYEEPLADRQRALASYEVAIAAVPLHRPALDARERLLTDASDRLRLADAAGREAASSGDEHARAQAALRAALAAADAELPAADALEAFRPLFAAHPNHLAALEAVERIYRRSSDAAGVAATRERIVQAIRDPNAELAALHALAQARLAAGDGAAGVYRRILQLAPHDPIALEALAAAARAEGDVATQLSMASSLASVATDPAVASDHLRRVGELRLAGGDAPGALESFRAAVAADPQSLGACRGLTAAAREAADAAALREAARHEHLVTRDEAAATRVLLESARLFFETDAEDDAAAVYREALSLAPDDPEAATGLMATMMRPDRIAELLELLTQAARAATDPGRSAVLHLCVAQLQADLKDALPAAIAATERALSSRPDSDVAHAQLATYLMRAQQWSDAAAALERALARPNAADREAAWIEAQLRLAQVAEHHLNDLERAMKSLRAVLSRDADHPAALTSLVRIERLRGHDEEALRLARRLIAVVEDEVQRAAALAEMAELEKNRGRIAEAAAAALSAVTIQGPMGSAARLYRGAIANAPEHASWDAYSAALVTYLERAKAARGDVAETYRELARVFGEASDQPERAIVVLREGVATCPQDVSIALALVRALQRAGEPTEALRELRRLLWVDVLDVGAWRELVQVARQVGEPDPAAFLAPLVFLGQADPEEERAARGRRPRVAAAPPGILAESGLKQLSEAGALDEGAASFIPALGEVLAKLEGFEPERWGVSKRDRLRPGDSHRVRAFADRIARIFAVGEFDVYLAPPHRLSRSFIVAGSPPALLVPSSFEAERDSVLAFHLARPLALLSRGLHPLDHVDDATMERIMVAAVRPLEPRFALDPFMPEEDIEAEGRRVGKAIGFFSRGRVQEAAAAFAVDPTRNYPMWAREVRRLATRAALLISDDLISILETIGEELGPDNYASDLARFWVADPALRFRRAVLEGAESGRDPTLG